MFFLMIKVLSKKGTTSIEYDLPSDPLKSCKLANRYVMVAEKVRKQKDDNVISKK